MNSILAGVICLGSVLLVLIFAVHVLSRSWDWNDEEDGDS